MRSIKALFKLPYWELLVLPAGFYWFGAFLNVFVIALNKGQMPVLWPGGCSTYDTGEGDDLIHRCMTHSDHFKFLADWMVVRGVGVMSPGDIFIMLSTNYAIYCYIIWAVSIALRPKE